MKFKELFSRITGLNVPVFGVSWNPPEPEVTAARRVLAFLEDRRVLFNPYHLEVADYCIESVIEIRRFLTEEIGRLTDASKLAEHLRATRGACRKFLDETSPGSRKIVRPHGMGHFGSEFFTSLGELRATIGIHVAAVAVMHGLDVEGELATILPASEPQNEPGPSKNRRTPAK